MDRIVNLDLLSNPANWVIVFLILYVAALSVKVLFQAASDGVSPNLQIPGL